MIALALAFWLHLTLPSHQAAGYGAGLYAEGTQPVTLDSLEVGYLEQSRTWLGHFVLMLNDPIQWLLWMPGVRMDAAPHAVLRRGLNWTQAGDTLTIALPDTFTVKRWWYVRTHNARGWSATGVTVWH